MNAGSRTIWSVEGLRRAGQITAQERNAALKELLPQAWIREVQRVLFALSALCAALALFSLAAYNFAAILQFLTNSLFWFLRLSTVVHVGLASLPLLLFGGLTIRFKPGFGRTIFTVLTMACIALPLIVAGQLYQIGANASGLFLVWFVLSLPLSIGAQSKVPWVVSQVLVYLFGFFFFAEVGFYLFELLAIIPLSGLALSALMRRFGPPWAKGEWYPTINLVALFTAMLAVLIQPVWFVLLVMGLVGGVFFAVLRARGVHRLEGGIAFVLLSLLLPIGVGRALVEVVFSLDLPFLLISSVTAALVVGWFILAINVLIRLRMREASHD